MWTCEGEEEGGKREGGGGGERKKESKERYDISLLVLWQQHKHKYPTRANAKRVKQLVSSVGLSIIIMQCTKFNGCQTCQ